MITEFKLFEEIKRKPLLGYKVDNTFNNNHSLNFNGAETKLLLSEDFKIADNIATDVEPDCIFEIEKLPTDEYSVFYELRIKDIYNNVEKSRKFKCDIYQRIKYLNAIIDICAAYLRDIKIKQHKNIDPYGEEIW